MIIRLYFISIYQKHSTYYYINKQYNTMIMLKKLLTATSIIFFYSCSNIGIENDIALSNTLITRSTNEYDVLGRGYDVTGDYLNPLSVRNQVVDIEKYKRDYPNRMVQNEKSFGYDQLFYGYSALDYVRTMTNETKVNSNTNIGQTDDEGKEIKFTKSITNNTLFKSEYSYSSKYSFASIDAIRHRKYIYINDEIDRISQYLSDEFMEDLNRLSTEKLIERYGTHVLTDFIIGGRYRILFRSVITKECDNTTKRQIVKSGFTATLSNIGFTANIENSNQIDNSLAKENHRKELYVSFFGGNGTCLKYDLEKGMPTTIDIAAWEKEVSIENANLTTINWKYTSPLYVFISDPIKKEKVKAGILEYLKKAQFTVIDLIPLHQYYHSKNKDHYTTPSTDITSKYSGWNLYDIEGYILKNPDIETVPIYEYYHKNGADHYTTTIPNIHITDKGWELQGIVGYVYKNSNNETTPLYNYFHKSNFDHFTSSNPDIAKTEQGWSLQNTSGHLYPAY